MIAQWSAAIAAAAFIVMTAGMLAAVRIALIRLSQLQQAAEAMRQDIARLTSKAERLIEPAERTLRTANSGLESAQRLFQAARHIGGAIAHTTSAIETAASLLSKTARHHAERDDTKKKAQEAMEWAELGMAAWQLWQSNRKREDGASSLDEEKPV